MQLGVGGLFALVIVREVLNFLKGRDRSAQAERIDSNGERVAGERSVEFWKGEAAAVLADGIRPLEARQERILASQSDTRNRMGDITTRMVIALEAIQKSLERIERQGQQRDTH